LTNGTSMISLLMVSFPFLLLVAEGAELFVFAMGQGVHSAFFFVGQGDIKQDKRRRGQLPVFVQSTVDALVARLVTVAVAINFDFIVHFAGINLLSLHRAVSLPHRAA